MYYNAFQQFLTFLALFKLLSKTRFKGFYCVREHSEKLWITNIALVSCQRPQTWCQSRLKQLYIHHITSYRFRHAFQTLSEDSSLLLVLVHQRIRGFAFMRYINPRLTLTLTLTYKSLHSAIFHISLIPATAYSVAAVFTPAIQSSVFQPSFYLCTHAHI